MFLQAPQEFNPYSDFNEQGRDEPSYQTFDPDPEPVAKQPEPKAPVQAQNANFFDTLDWDAGFHHFDNEDETVIISSKGS